MEFAEPPDGLKAVWAQDRLAEEAENILPQIQAEGNRMVISDTLIDRIGTAAKDEGDTVPGLAP